MEVLHKITGQIASVGLPLVAVTLTAVPCANTPVLLILHWHGFRRPEESEAMADLPASVPGSALQVNERWDALARLDEAMLDAAWQFGAWELDREERRGCNTVGADDREATSCLQAFGEHPFAGAAETLIADAPDQPEMLRLGAEVGYVRWQFRPVRGGLWGPSPEDCSLAADGGRKPPCPVQPLATVGPRVSRTRYQLGRCNKILLL